MIVQCDNCQTKFRIGDEKVTPEGVKVRCSRCAHVFVVRREPPLDPFAAPPAAGSGAAESDRASAWTSQPAGVPTAPPATVAPPAPPATRSNRRPALHASSSEAAIALGFAGATPDPPLSTPGGLSGLPRGFSSAQTERFSAQHETTEQMPAWDAEETKVAPEAPLSTGRHEIPTPKANAAPEAFQDSSPPFGASSPFAGSGASSPFAGGGASSPFAGGGAPTDPFAAAPASADPFGAPGPTDPFAPAPGAPDPFAAPPAAPSDPFGVAPASTDPFSAAPPAKDAPFAAGPTTPASGAAALPSFPDAAPSPASSGDRFPPPSPMGGEEGGLTEMELPGIDASAASGEFPPPPVDLGPGAAPATAEELGDLPGLLSYGVTDDPFAGVDAELSSGSMGAYHETSAISDEMPELGGALPSAGPLDVPTGEAMARIDLGRAGLPPGDAAFQDATAIAPNYQPAPMRSGPARSDAKSEGLGWWPTALGIAAGILLAWFLVPDLAAWIGGVHFAPTGRRVELPNQVEGLVATGAKVTTYPNEAGRSLLVVSGTARAASAVGTAEAVVLVLDRDEVVAEGRAPVGAVLDEAALAGMVSESALRSAYQDRPTRALERGDSAPFMVVFWNIPPGAEERTFEVTFVKAGEVARVGDL